MKRIALLLALLMLAAPAAFAQQAAEATPATRQEIIALEGMEERITTQYFESPHGWYSIWIDPEILAPLAMEQGDDRDFFLPPDAADDSAFQLTVLYRADCTLEQAFADALVDVNDAFGACEEITDVARPVFAGDYRELHANSGDQSTTHYVLGGVEGAYVIALNYPAEAAEGFASRVESMLRSFVPADAPPPK